jgi:hypothetical protein
MELPDDWRGSLLDQVEVFNRVNQLPHQLLGDRSNGDSSPAAAASEHGGNRSERWSPS